MLSLRQGENKCFSFGVTVPSSLSGTSSLISCGVACYLHMCGWAAGALHCCLGCWSSLLLPGPLEPQLRGLTSIFKGDALQLVTSLCSRLLLRGVLECLTESCGETDHLGEVGVGKGLWSHLCSFSFLPAT